ncbi:MAG: hypothetical protein JWM36_3011 [Hyphomicrobiales bacterium]|nr:hypothetical protein [Hyphomicrobiales bacterium]
MSVLHGISLADPMIESDRVEGLRVDDVSGRHLGVVKRLLIARDLGIVTYAMSCSMILWGSPPWSMKCLGASSGMTPQSPAFVRTCPTGTQEMHWSEATGSGG